MNDDKNYGFVEPSCGVQCAFVHIKFFKPDCRRLVNGDIIIYELVREKDARYKTKNIKFTRGIKNSKSQTKVKISAFFGMVFERLVALMS